MKPKRHLLEMPPEIRAKIWDQVFVLPGSIAPMIFSPRASRESSVLRVLAVCRMIYMEAFHIFYAKNDLEFSSTYALFHFLTSLNPKRRLEITAISVSNFGLHYSSTQFASKAFSLLLLCPRLHSFRLDMTLELSWEFFESHGSREKLRSIPEDVIWSFNLADVQAGFHVLHSLRGLTTVSIRGINPEYWAKMRHSHRFQPSDLEEISTPYASLLKANWMRPALQCSERRTNRVALALSHFRVNGLASENYG